MRSISLYDRDGRIVSAHNIQDDHVEEVAAGRPYVEGFWSGATHHVVNGKVTALPKVGPAYWEKRLCEYPSIGDQLDALYKAGVFPREMAEQIAAVKAKYPKP